MSSNESSFKTESELLALLVLIGVIGLYGFFGHSFALIITSFLSLTGTTSRLIIAMLIMMLLQVIVLIVFFWINHSSKENYFISISKDFSKGTLIITLFGLLMITLFSIFYAFFRLGYLSPLPLNEWPETLLSALYFGIVEELEFRSILLVHIDSWIRKTGINNNNRENSLFITVLIITLLFGPIYHNRYLFGGDLLILLAVTVFGLAATLVTLKTKSIVPAIVLHVGLDFIIFLFIGGTIKQL